MAGWAQPVTAWKVAATDRTMIVEREGWRFNQSYDVIAGEHRYTFSDGRTTAPGPQLHRYIQMLRLPMGVASMKELSQNDDGVLYSVHDHPSVLVVVVMALAPNGDVEVQLKTRGALNPEDARYALGVLSAFSTSIDVQSMSDRLRATAVAFEEITAQMVAAVGGADD